MHQEALRAAANREMELALKESVRIANVRRIIHKISEGRLVRATGDRVVLTAGECRDILDYIETLERLIKYR